MRRTSLATAVAAVLVATGVPVAAATSLRAPAHAADPRPAVIGHRVIGKTVAGRKIHAWRVGERDARTKAVALATMHGDELDVRQILRCIRDGRPVEGIDLWLVPVLNRDGVARGTRKNKRGVDLNRNFPVEWAELDGEIESGPRPRSEPETRALMRFLNRVDPRFVVSLHQPLHGIDVYGPKKRWFARRLARELHLPTKEFACGNACHGTLTQWFNKRHDGVAVTVEYGADPRFRRMNRYAPRQLIRALGGSR
jgi:hypothetical protein